MTIIEAAPVEALSQHELLRDSVARGVEGALNTINERYGLQQTIENRLTFHNIHHTQDVIRRSALITQTVREADPGLIDDHTAEVIPLIAADHDSVQDYDLVAGENEGQPTVKRVRHTGANEAASSDELITFMHHENANSTSGTIYTEADMQLGEESIMATVPGWNPELSTVVQPNKQITTNLSAEIVPLADLGSAGIDGAEAAVKDNDLLFIEENVDVARRLFTGEPMDAATKAWLKARIVTSTVAQKAFIAGRRELLDQDLAKFPAHVVTALKEKVFTKFDEANAAIEAEIAWRREATPEAVIGKLQALVAEAT